MVRCVVGADVLGGPRARGRHGAVRGRGRRPRRPAWPCASSAASLGRGAPRTSRPTRCAHARCAHGVRVRRAPCVCGHGAVRGRGRRPGGPRARVRPRRRLRGRGAPRTSRPTMCSAWCGACVVGADVPAARVSVFGMVRCVVGADVLGGPRGRGRPRRCPLGATSASLPCVGFGKNEQKCCTEGGSGLPRPPSCEIMASTLNPKGRR